MPRKNQSTYNEEGIDVPYDHLNPETLQKLVEEFVSREWSDLCDSGFSLDDKVGQVLLQLKEKKAKLVFDFNSNTANIVACP
jgi:uncharacterized protein YheU (UPF0270 family)